MKTLFSQDRSRTRSKTIGITSVFGIVMLFFAPYAAAQDYQVIDAIYAGDVTQDVDVNPVTNRIYVAALGDDAVYVIDGETNSVITTVPVGVWPRGVAVDVDTNRIYVGNSQSASVSVIDGLSNTVVDTVPVGSGPTEGMKLNPNTGRLYVTNFNDDTLSVIDTTTNTVISTVSVGSHPAGVAINTTSNIIYVSNRFENTISVVDGNTNTVTDVINVGFWPGIPDFNPATNRLYLPIRFDSVWVFDGTTNSLIANIPVGGPVFAAVDAIRNHIYVTNREDATVAVIDGVTNDVVDSVPVGPEPGGIAVNPATNRIYATQQGDDTLSVIASVVQEVDIDIKPGNKRNVINPRAKGGIWVAILSDTDPDSPFDPSSQVDMPTVEFGPDGAKAIRHKVKDINKDGLGDLLLRFKIPETGIACGDTEATLTGETIDGQNFAGTDAIKTVGCPKHVIPETAIQNPDNGHWYERFDSTMTWHDAKTFCEGLSGYVATLTSPVENDFVYDHLVVSSPRTAIWLGATDEVEENVWQWITGEDWIFSSWGSSEPNNCAGIEHYLTFYGQPYIWNDLGSCENPAGEGGGAGCGGCPEDWEPVSTICEWDSKKPPKTFEKQRKAKGKKR